MMNKVTYKSFCFGLALFPIIGAAQQKDTGTTVQDSLQSNLIVAQDSTDSVVPLEQLKIVKSSNAESLALFKPTESSTYNLQDNGRNTIEANHDLGLNNDEREYSAAVEIVNKLNIQSVKLMTNNPVSYTHLTLPTKRIV